ncbi:uncharacterized protein EI90DRAFT_3280114 [Cantharellus anzutake]|uniref:uncharacterized protein n=1 Tax=Cantharellus anzutake TaxID=1750568 RepID=UPI0019047116|nr:uncharacterized protein EI90DRAFT_3280114 [Cantharellus anzutake]KAF8334965.1 hypothetical protein EI90DRAFT_3280114 [Cantharellus anzutake]
MGDHGDGNIKVVVRVRPLNAREIARGAKFLIRMQGNQTFLDPPDEKDASGRATERKTMAFTFDKSYWSAGARNDTNYCSQQTLYDDLGKELLEHGFAGFNACILTYGQTGSGKSYSMMGYGADKGIIPLTCEELFRRVEEQTSADPNLAFTVEVSYIEIYNEKVKDLLNPKNKGNLKVREHPILGPYVEDLSKLMVSSYTDMMTLMDEGNKARTVAATQMNETSSRSHAVFTLVLTQKRCDVETNLDTEKVSRISLVDLAGSERANSTGATGTRLKEGANINKSLTTLGNADPKGAKPKKATQDFIPYRDSVLTWLLKDSLGGNSKTAMIAAISPADYDETLSTLRYADQAKKIKNKAVVNEDPNAKLVRELKEELEMLRARVASGGGGSGGEATFDPTIPASKQMVTYQTKDGQTKTVSKAKLQEQLESREKLMKSLNETWEEKMQRTQEIHKEREQALEELGITVDKNNVGVHTPRKMPHLVNLNEDPLMSECLVYQLKPGRTTVGKLDSETPSVIRLSGSNILDEHCYFENREDLVTLHSLSGSITLVNGKQVDPDHPIRLRSGFRVILGDCHVFRFNNPVEVRRQRDRAKTSMHVVTFSQDLEVLGERPASPAGSASSQQDVDWMFAQREAALARLHGLDPGLDSLPDEDLNKLFDRITKLKSSREHHSSVKGDRPESRMSTVEDMWSEPGRPFSHDAFTDATSLDTRANGSPDLDGITELQGQLDANKQEFEARLSAIHDADTEDIRAEKENMETQLRMVQLQMKRLLDLRARGVAADSAEFTAFEATIYSARQLRLIRKVLDRWRAHRSFSMAESILAHAVTVKEANVISKTLDKHITYNFTIAAGGALAAPASALLSIAGLGEIGNVTDPALASATQPSVGVKVLDKKHNAVYVWSLDRLQQQVQRMRNLSAFIDRPSYSQHFASEEAFYDNPAPEYSFVGNALICLANLVRRLSSTSTVPIFCRYTSEAIGSCRVDVRTVNPPSALRSPNGSLPQSRASSPLPGAAPTGSKLSFFLTVDNVKGPSSLDFSAIHLQVRLSAFLGTSLATEEVFTSNSVDLDTSVSSELRFRRMFSIAMTNRVINHLRDGYAPIEFFAIVKPQYLERLERWDEIREQRITRAPPESSSSSSVSCATSNSPQPPMPSAMRRSENDFVAEQAHDVTVWLRILELTANGEYRPVPVRSQGYLDPGSFTLHQGLQRRILLVLTSNSGRQLPWSLVCRIRIGRIRLLDEKGRLQDTASKDLCDLKILRHPSVEYRPDGTGSLTVEALWDSGVHDSHLLNRVTAPNQRVLLQLHFAVDIDTCLDPATFNMDFAIVMQGRDAKPPGRLVNMLTSTKALSKTSTIFSLRLTPPLTRSVKDLWRLDTSEKYVRGEEVLGSWKPRGISVVEDYVRLDSTERRAADVHAVRAVLASLPPSFFSVSNADRFWNKDELLHKVIELWKRRFGHRGRPDLTQFPTEEGTPRPALKRKHAPLEPVKLVASTKLVPRTDGATKKGHLLILADAGENLWVRRWFVLRRPHLYVYAHSNELDEVGIISLSGSGVKVERSDNMDALFGRKHTFTLFTPSNSHALAAPNPNELQLWITKIDPTQIPTYNGHPH